MDYSIEELVKIEDKRGFLVEFLKSSELAEDEKPFGQIYLTTIKGGCARGNHYHRRKKEFYVIMSGKALLLLEAIDTKERKEFEIDASGDKIVRISVGPNVAHAIKNISDGDIILCAYSTIEYDKNAIDQEVYKLL
jgi:dTDP-4-dehydrorhamnose 3,5-epimerase-like enzyme